MTTNHAERLALALADREFEDARVREVSPDGGHPLVTFEDGWSLLVCDELGGVARAPEPGDVLRKFGAGIGRPVRGIGRLNGRGKLVELYRYRTADEAKADHEAEVTERKAQRRAEREAKKDETAAGVRDMPEPFRKRFEFFMRRPGWGAEFGPYELFVCGEAVKIAEALKTPERVREFARLDCEVQKKRIPSLAYDEHSGNTFGMACRLAHVYLDQPALLPKVHGALCALVGCEDYGCFAGTDEAKRERATQP